MFQIYSTSEELFVTIDSNCSGAVNDKCRVMPNRLSAKYVSTYINVSINTVIKKIIKMNHYTLKYVISYLKA